MAAWDGKLSELACRCEQFFQPPPLQRLVRTDRDGPTPALQLRDRQAAAYRRLRNAHFELSARGNRLAAVVLAQQRDAESFGCPAGFQSRLSTASLANIQPALPDPEIHCENFSDLSTPPRGGSTPGGWWGWFFAWEGRRAGGWPTRYRVFLAARQHRWRRCTYVVPHPRRPPLMRNLPPRPFRGAPLTNVLRNNTL
jgi:hypothetical protein